MSSVKRAAKTPLNPGMLCRQACYVESTELPARLELQEPAKEGDRSMSLIVRGLKKKKKAIVRDLTLRASGECATAAGGLDAPAFQTHLCVAGRGLWRARWWGRSL